MPSIIKLEKITINLGKTVLKRTTIDYMDEIQEKRNRFVKFTEKYGD